MFQMGGKILIKSLVLLSICFFFLHHVAVLCESVDQIIAPMEKAEKEALYLMIQGFVGEWWNGSELYPDPCGWTPIQGVSCDLFNDSWYVTSISIGPVLENSLKCSHNPEFRPHLFELNHLKTLSFFNCFSSPTTLPSMHWDNLSQTLENLEFRSNKGLVGEIPPIFGQLFNLRSLILVENSLSGYLPQELGNLVHLKRLSLSGNQFSGPIPTSLGKNLVDLLILDLSRNSLHGPLHSSLCELTSLLKLDISNNHLNGAIPKEFGYMKSLTLIDLRNNNLSGGLTKSIEGMVSLQDMLLSNNQIGGYLNDIVWDKLVNLTILDLSNMNLIGEIPDSFARLKKLRFLALKNNQLSGSITTKLEALPCLGALYLNSNNFSGEILFSEEFYNKIGRRFASWGNHNLCYKIGAGPVGVKKCKYEFDSKTKVGSNRDQTIYISHSGFSASCVKECLLLLMQVLVIIVMLL